MSSNISELYTGYLENMLYAYPADVIKFVAYESLTKGRKDLSPFEGARAGAISTAIAQLVTTPLDVVRNYNPPPPLVILDIVFVCNK